MMQTREESQQTRPLPLGEGKGEGKSTLTPNPSPKGEGKDGGRPGAIFHGSAFWAGISN
jgi:hypothetical protein